MEERWDMISDVSQNRLGKKRIHCHTYHYKCRTVSPLNHIMAIGLIPIRELEPKNSLRIFIVIIIMMMAELASRYSISIRARRCEDRILARERISAPLQTDSGTYPASYKRGAGSFSLR